MPKSTDACNRILNLMYSATAWATVAQNSGASPLTNVVVALHSAPLNAATNSQAENEVAYTNYARQNVARSTGWTAGSGGSISNAALLQFPQSGATGATLNSVSTGTTISGATPVWHYGTLNSPITIGASASITPQFLGNALVVTET
jgi:predicted extracellular nuclease